MPTEMKMTDTEKLMLIMLSEIHTALKIKDGIDPKFVAEAIYSGNTWAIPFSYTGIFGPTENPSEVVEEVMNILDMWQRIEESYDALTKQEKARVVKESGKFSEEPKFFGFDGNREGEYLSVARMFTEKLDRWQHFKGRIHNSHMPSIDIHRRLLSGYAKVEEASLGRYMTADELIQVLKERIHPENRK